jgi:hypothetical protein
MTEGELPGPHFAALLSVRARSQYAVAETAHNGMRVLCMTDDRDEAVELVAELRRRGAGAGAYRTSPQFGQRSAVN